MTEGWLGDDYLILFDETEIASVSESYAISQFLPDHQVVGLFGWDDFIVRDSGGKTSTVPTVPVTTKYLSPYVLPTGGAHLNPDDRVLGKIKWYVQPVAFGGDMNLGSNAAWMDHAKHQQLVRYWNELYLSAKKQPIPPAGP